MRKFLRCTACALTWIIGIPGLLLLVWLEDAPVRYSIPVFAVVMLVGIAHHFVCDTPVSERDWLFRKKKKAKKDLP